MNIIVSDSLDPGFVQIIINTFNPELKMGIYISENHYISLSAIIEVTCMVAHVE